jgi:phage baseplate assembly protein W
MNIIPVIVPTQQQIIFSDINLSLGEESSYDLVYDEDSIQKSISMILGTKKGTRVFRRTFGSNVEALLWDPMDDITVGKMKTEIFDAIVTWETRINLSAVVVKPDYPNEQYYIRMDYTIPALANKFGSFTFNLSRGGS